MNRRWNRVGPLQARPGTTGQDRGCRAACAASGRNWRRAGLDLAALLGLVFLGLGVSDLSARAEDLAIVPAPAPAPPADGLPEILGAAEGVKDPVFGLLINLVATGSYGTLTQERLVRELGRLKTTSPLPYRTVRSVTREAVRPGWTSRVTVELVTPLDLDVPYSILGYHPGSFTTTQRCTFREWQFPSLDLVEVSGSGKETKRRAVTLEEVHLFALDEGEIWIDIDALVDRLLGGAIDDTRVTVLALARYEGEWIGVASGYGREGKGRSGLMSFRRDKILFPTPEALKGIGRQLRSKAEALARIWDAGEAGRGAPAALEVEP